MQSYTIPKVKGVAMRLITTLILSLAVAISASEQNIQQEARDKKASEKPADRVPTVEQIIDKYVQHLRGELQRRGRYQDSLHGAPSESRFHHDDQAR